ncbi:MlaE family ABC transporter permease [Tepidicaulis sp. LMO-SS28]|uniref:MlaE family ABC transporter permease n=1 Tax=Tepidicaulis sp. LMO-SS28 TaxID=3447455 RepID=UPI003EE3EE0D
MNIFAAVGRVVLTLLAETGRLSLFIWMGVSHLVRPPFYWRVIGQQMMRIGYFSLPVVALTAFFTGGVLALQIYYGGNQFNSESIVATIVALGITRELGPVLGGLMVAGRASAAIAAELGTMRVTEQIDALSTLSTNPYKYLVVPRLMAAIVTLPALVFIGDVIGIFGGFVVGTQSLDFNSGVYVKTTVDFLELDDVTSGLIKASVFGFIIAIMGCFHGFNSKGGAQGVGRATTNAVVTASILILAANYVMTSLLFSS